MERTITIDITQKPAISGYGGYDLWKIHNIPDDKIDKFLNELDVLVKKHNGEYEGHN